MSTSASSSKPAAASGTSSTQVPEPSKTAYRNPVVEDDDDDDDLDDLDDVLNSFNAPKSTLGKRSEPDRTAAALAGAGSSSSRSPAPAAGGAEAGGDIDDDEFQASLMDGMESLLRSLAVDHPPGPMPGATSGSPDKSGAAAAGDMSSEEEEKAFQRAVEMMLSGEGMEALGLDGKKGASPGPSTRAGGAAPATGGPAGKASFDDTIRRTMESLNAGGAGASNDGMPEDLAALLAQLSKDPSALDGLGEDDDELGGLLDSMMGQLMSKEVLEEPMTELAAKYPGYLESPPAGVKEPELVKYRQQHKLVLQILEVFKRPQYADDTDGKEVARLVGEMQDLGGPPNEIMGDLPEGFDLGALGGGDEQCVIM